MSADEMFWLGYLVGTFWALLSSVIVYTLNRNRGHGVER